MISAAVESGCGLTLAQCAAEIAFPKCAVRGTQLGSTDGRSTY